MTKFQTIVHIPRLGSNSVMGTFLVQWFGFHGGNSPFYKKITFWNFMRQHAEMGTIVEVGFPEYGKADPVAKAALQEAQDFCDTHGLTLRFVQTRT